MNEKEKYEKLLAAVMYVLNKFKKDEADGYRSRDRQFTIMMLEKAIKDE